MGQKVNPHGLRVGVIKDWDSRWFVKDEVFGDTLVSDYKLRKFLKDKLKQAGVPKIEIERDNAKIRVVLHCAKPGIIIGHQGAGVEALKKSSARRSKPSSASLPASTWSRLSSPTSTRSSSPKAFPRSWKSVLRSAAR